jgi:hypothetical protein
LTAVCLFRPTVSGWLRFSGGYANCGISDYGIAIADNDMIIEIHH